MVVKSLFHSSNLYKHLPHGGLYSELVNQIFLESFVADEQSKALNRYELR